MCTSNNTCMDHEVTDELSSRLTSFQTTYIENLISDSADFLSNDTQKRLIQDIIEELAKISDAVSRLNETSDEGIGKLLGEWIVMILFTLAYLTIE